MYLEIVKTLDVKKLLVCGNSTIEDCQKHWDEIIHQCSAATGGLDFVNFIDMSQSYGILLSQYNIVKAWLMKLWFQVDDKIIEELEEKGYAIVTSKNHPKFNPELSISDNYSQSILNALRRSEHLVTKLKMKSNEMQMFLNGSEGGRKEMLFDEIMAHLLVRGIKAEDNISLSRYMQLLKILNKPKQENVYG